MIVQEEKDSFSHIGTTSGGGVHPGRRADRRLHRRAAPGAGRVRAPLPGARVDRGPLPAPQRGPALPGLAAGPLRLSAWSTTSAPARLGVRQFRFPGWRAWMDGKRIPVEVAPYVPQQQAGLGFIVLTVPPGGAHAQPGPRAHPLEGRRDGPGRPRRGWPGGSAARRPAGTPPPPGHAGPAGGLPPALPCWATAPGAALRPAFGRFAVPPAPPAVPVDGVFGTSPLPPGSGALLVNSAQPRATGRRASRRPAGPAWPRAVRGRALPDGGRSRPRPGSRRDLSAGVALPATPPSEVAIDLAVPGGGRSGCNPCWRSTPGPGTPRRATACASWPP